MAEEYLKKSVDVLNIPEMLPIQAYLEVLKSNAEKANEFIRRYLREKRSKRLIFNISTTLALDRTFEKVENNFFIGISYYKMKNFELARKYLLESCSCKYDNYYSKRSNELLSSV